MISPQEEDYTSGKFPLPDPQHILALGSTALHLPLGH